MARIDVRPEPLTAAAFAPFGQVIETAGAREMTINDGFATRYHDLAAVDVAEAGGRPSINVFRARPWPTPIRVETMERHPLSSQAFVPLGDRPFLVVVAVPGDDPAPVSIRAFVTDGRQGVNFARGTWHHPLLVLDRESDFLVVDRIGPQENCDLVHFGPGDDEVVIALDQEVTR